MTIYDRKVVRSVALMVAIVAAVYTASVTYVFVAQPGANQCPMEDFRP